MSVGPQLKDGHPTPGAGPEVFETLGRTFWAEQQHAVAITDRDGTITAWSPGAVAMSGICEADALGRSLARMRGEDDGATAALLAAAEPESVSTGSWRDRPDGTRWFAASFVFPLRDAETRAITGFAEIMRDETAHVEERAAQEEADRRFAEALRAGQVAVFRQDADLRYTWVVNAIPETQDFTRDVIGATDADLMPADVVAEFIERKQEILRTGERQRFDYSVGEGADTVHYDVSIAPLFDADGTVTGLTGVLVDVTAPRTANEELRRASQRLAEAEGLAQVGSWERDLVRGTSYWSPGIFALYGLDPETTTPSLDVFLGVVHPDDRDDVAAVIREAEKNGGAYEIEHRAVRADGRVRWIYSRAEVLEAGADGPLRIAGNARDVTEAHRVGVALRDAAERLNPQQRRDHGGLGAKLSARQLEVLALVADGLTNIEIADRLYISEATVKWHMRQILRVLGVTNRAQAVARYLKSQQGAAGGR